MSSLTRVIVFAVAVVALYTAFAVWFVPDITPEPPPVPVLGASDEMTATELVSLGERLYMGRGSCALCHEAVGSRAPSLDGIFIRAGRRVDEDGYTGGARDALGYVIESMEEPSAYVVRGYAAPGSGGVKSPMPRIDLPPIGLNAAEMRAIAAYLQKRSGFEVSAGLPGEREVGR